MFSAYAIYRKGLQEGKCATADRICSVLDSNWNVAYDVSAQQTIGAYYHISIIIIGL